MSSALSSREQKAIQRTLAILLTLIMIFVAGFVYRMTQPREFSAAEFKLNGLYLFEKPRALSEFQLVGDDGAPFTLKNLQGQWSLVFFGFTSCPDVCPTTMATLKQLYEKMEPGDRADTRIFLASADPARDTPERLREYVQYFHPDFLGLTGDFLVLHQFATELNTPIAKVPGGGENYMVEHGANIAIINPRGHYLGFIKAPLDVEKNLLAYSALRRSSTYSDN